MAAPTIVPAVHVPGTKLAGLPYGFNAGFDFCEQIVIGTGAFRLIQSTANPLEYYLTAFAGSAPAYTDPKPTLATKAVGFDTELFNFRCHYYRPTFTAFDLTNLVDAGDRTQTGITGNVTVSTTVEPEPDCHYEIRADLAWTSGNSLTVDLLDQDDHFIGSVSNIKNTDDEFVTTINSGAFTAIKIVLKCGSSVLTVTNISVAQVTKRYDAALPLRSGTPGSLPRFGYGVGDNDSLGYETVYIRLSDEVPVSEQLTVVYDTSSTGDGSLFKDLTIEWWLDPALSTGVPAWPDRFRYVVEPRFKGTSREGELVDLGGKVPDASRGSPVQGSSMVWVFTEGNWAPRCRVINKSKETATHAFETQVVAADSRTPILVDSNGSGAYTSIAAAVTANAGSNRVFVLAGGHDETLTARINSPGSYYAVRWNREGVRPIIRFDPAPSGNFDAFRISNAHDWCAIDGIAFHTVGVSSGNNPQDVPVEVLAAKGWAVTDCTITPLDGNPNFAPEGFVGTSNISANNTRRCMVGLIQNISSPTGIDGYFYACQNAVWWEQMVNIRGCTVGPSVQESCIRLTNPNCQLVISHNDLSEDEKDTVRLVQGEGVSLVFNRFDGANRNGASSEGVSIARGLRIEGNVNNRTQPASLGCYAFNAGVYDSRLVNCVAVLNRPVQAVGGDAEPGFSGVDNGYQGSRGIKGVDIDSVTVVVKPSSLTTGSAISGAGVNNGQWIVDQRIRGCVFSDESGGAWTGSTVVANAATASNNAAKANRAMSEFFVATTPATGTRPDGAYYDMWGNVLGTSNILGAAIANPPSESAVSDLVLTEVGGGELPDPRTLSAQVGAVVPFSFEVRNEGSGPGTVISGSASGVATLVTDINNAVVAPGGILTVSGTATSATVANNQVGQVSLNTSDGTLVHNIRLSATGLPAALTVRLGGPSGEAVATGLTTQLDPVLPGGTIAPALTLTNSGGQVLAIQSLSVLGGLSVADNDDPSQTTLEPGETITVPLAGDTEAVGSYAGSVSLATDAGVWQHTWVWTVEAAEEPTVDGPTGPAIDLRYNSLAEADALVAISLPSTHPHRMAYEAASAADRTVALNQATIDFDQVRTWSGLPAVADQPNAWPRLTEYRQPILPGGEPSIPASLGQTAWTFPGIPREIRIGHALQAAARIAAANGQDPAMAILNNAASGIVSQSGGGISWGVDSRTAAKPTSRLHPEVRAIVGRYLKKFAGVL